MATTRFTVHYSVWTDIDTSAPVTVGSKTFDDPALRHNRQALIEKIHESEPTCDERIHPVVEILMIDDEDGTNDADTIHHVISGCWPHIFTEGERNVRFACDQNGELLALEVETGFGWRRPSKDEWDDVQDSLRNGNEEAIGDPNEHGLSVTDLLPAWADAVSM